MKKKSRGKTDWARLRAMSDAEARKNALEDPDNPPLTKEELKGLARGIPPIRHARRRLEMTQAEFAEAFGIPLHSLRDWEQARHEPSPTAKAYLAMIVTDPHRVLKLRKKLRQGAALT